MHEITELAISSAKINKFTVKEVQTSDIINIKDWWSTYYKKQVVSEETMSRSVPRAEKIIFGISTMAHFSYSSALPGCIITRNFIDSMVKHTFKVKHAGDQIPQVPTARAYDQNVPIKKEKIIDIKKLLQYVPEEHMMFFNDIKEWPTV